MLSLGYIKASGMPRRAVGSFSQACYRFNTYVGMAVMMSVFGEDGVRRFGVLIALVIPLINVLAIGTLTWFGGGPAAWRRRAEQTLKALAVNPLILGCIGGVVYNQTINRFPLFLDNTLRLASYVTLPLALISIVSASMAPPARQTASRSSSAYARKALSAVRRYASFFVSR